FSDRRYSEAEPLLARAASAMPKDFNSWYVLGLARQRLEKREAALRAWRSALQIQPKNVKLMQVMVVEFSQGRYYLEAAGLASRALELKSDDANLYFLAIKAYQDARDYGKALEVARRALERFPQSARANFEVAFHLQKLGQVPQSLDYLKKAMAADPDYEEPFFY